MNMSIEITGPEVKEAIEMWLVDHGLSGVTWQFVTANGNTIEPENMTVRIRASAPHVEGPYR